MRREYRGAVVRCECGGRRPPILARAAGGHRHLGPRLARAVGAEHGRRLTHRYPPNRPSDLDLFVLDHQGPGWRHWPGVPRHGSHPCLSLEELRMDIAYMASTLTRKGIVPQALQDGMRRAHEHFVGLEPTEAEMD